MGVSQPSCTPKWRPQANRPDRDSRVILLDEGKLLECQYAPSLSRTVQTRRFAPRRPRPKEPQCALRLPPMTVLQTGPSDRVTVRPTAIQRGTLRKRAGVTVPMDRAAIVLGPRGLPPVVEAGRGRLVGRMRTKVSASTRESIVRLSATEPGAA